MPVRRFCNRCGKELSFGHNCWLPAFDGLCSGCQDKVSEKISKAVKVFEFSLRSDGVSEYEIKRLSSKFSEELANEE